MSDNENPLSPVIELAARVAVLFFRAWVIVLLWHPVAQALFRLPPIGYWQAVGLCLLLASAHK